MSQNSNNSQDLFSEILTTLESGGNPTSSKPNPSGRISTERGSHQYSITKGTISVQDARNDKKK